MSIALTAIISQTYNKILVQLLKQHGIEFICCSSFNELNEAATEHTSSELIFVSREIIKSSGKSVIATLNELRQRVSGSIYILSSSKEQSDIHEFIHAGASDVILTSKVKQVEGIIRSYRVHLDTQVSEVPYCALLVEDSKSLCSSLKQCFEEQGLKVLTAESAKTAIDLLQQHDIDVIVCDLVLKGDETGLKVVRRACEDARWKSIPIMITTSFTDVSRQKHLYQLGVDDVIQKPYDFEIVTAKTLKMARDHRLHSLLLEERCRIEKMAFENPETGLHNRAFLNSYYDEWLVRQRSSFYTLLIEIDNFQSIKREYGLNQCEKAQRIVADALRKFQPEGAITAHLMGEQFVMLTAKPSEDTIKTLAKNLISEVSKSRAIEQQPLSICVGIAEGHEKIALAEVIKIADGCLYLAQEEGTGQYEMT